MDVLPVADLLAASAQWLPVEPIAVRSAAAKDEKPVHSTELCEDDSFLAALLAQVPPMTMAPSELPPEPESTPTVSQSLPFARPVLAARPASPASVPALISDGSTTEPDPITMAAAEPALLEQAPIVAGAELPMHSAKTRDKSQAVIDLPAPELDQTATRAPKLEQAAASEPPTDTDIALIRTVLEQALNEPAFGNRVEINETGTNLSGMRSMATIAEYQAHGPRHATLPVNQPEFLAERLSQQISIMLNQHTQVARIACSPAELGPVEVRIQVVGNEASIDMVATHLATRQALEEALPRLRAAFSDGGVTLAHTGVFADMPQHQQRQPAVTGDFDPIIERSPDLAPEVAPQLMISGLIDAFV